MMYVSDTCGTLYEIAAETEKTTYYPEEMDRMKITTRRRKIEIKIEKKKITIPKGKRERKKKFKSGDDSKEDRIFVKTDKYRGFCAYHRSYLLWSPVIVL